MNDLDLARTAAAAGAAIVASWADRVGDPDFKGAVDPVTSADRESEEAILGLLAEYRPDDAVVGEEGSSRDGTSGRRWLVDPLDGTVNFLHGYPQVSVSIAVEDDSGGIVGVVRDVFRDEEFVALRGEGASMNGRGISVSACSSLDRALVATGFGYDRQQRGPEYGCSVGEMLRHVQGIRRGGSAALDLAWIACGRLDGYWEATLGPWDVAAGLLLVTEAGGMATGYEGGAASHRSVVAAGPELHPHLLEAVATAVGS